MLDSPFASRYGLRHGWRRNSRTGSRRGEYPLRHRAVLSLGQRFDLGKLVLHNGNCHVGERNDVLAPVFRALRGNRPDCLDAWRTEQCRELSRAEAVRQILDWAFMK